MEPKTLITRQEQKTEDTWNLEDLYGSIELYEEDQKKLNALMQEFSTCQNTLGTKSEALYKALSLYEEISSIFSSLYVYANQHYHEDTTNPFYQKLSGETQILAASLDQTFSWFEPEILSLSEETLDQFFSQNASLKKYSRFLYQITRKREHILDSKTEALLARMGELSQTPSNIFSMFNNADIRFPEVTDSTGNSRPLTHGTYISCLESTDRTLRKSAFESLYSVYKQFSNTLASAFYANAKQADIFAKERHYKNAMEESLSDNAIPVSVYQNLIQAVHENLPSMHQYIQLRKKALDLPELHMYDIYVPIMKRPEKNYTFEEAKEIVLRGLSPLGEEYLSHLKEGFENRWIDIYENKGKRSGAYSWGAYGTHPYVLLNYNGSLNNVFTLAHEMGHALHTWYSNTNQAYLDSGYRIFVAEVASTCNEALLIHDLMKRSTDPDEKNYLINYFLEQFRGTIFRQTMFAEFEMLTHEMVEKGEMLTAESLCDLYLELNKKYFGDDIICDPEIAYEWARIPHFYTPFYVYQYATGFSAAIAISTKILNGEEGIIEKYKTFLSGGSSQDPIDLLKICGIDMSSKEPVLDALKVFKEYLDILS